MLRIQRVDKPSDSDRLCLHGLFSNRPTQSHQWGAHTHTHTPVHAHRLWLQCTLIYSHQCCQCLSRWCTKAATHSVRAGLPSKTQTVNTHTRACAHTKLEWRRAKRRRARVLNTFLPRLRRCRNGVIMTRDERATMVFITLPHVPLHSEKEASGVCCRPKTRRTFYRGGVSSGL